MVRKQNKKENKGQDKNSNYCYSPNHGTNFIPWTNNLENKNIFHFSFSFFDIQRPIQLQNTNLGTSIKEILTNQQGLSTNTRAKEP